MTLHLDPMYCVRSVTNADFQARVAPRMFLHSVFCGLYRLSLRLLGDRISICFDHVQDSLGRRLWFVVLVVVVFENHILAVLRLIRMEMIV